MAVAVLIVTAGAAGTALASQGPRTIHYTATATCAQISQTGSTLKIVCAGTTSIGQDGAAVATITLNGTHGTATAVGYFANGVRESRETFTLAMDATGMVSLTGTGTCTGGTGFFKHARCSYTLTGTTNPKTLVGSSNEVGTITR
jgi:Na+/glutamate symporter